MVPRSLMPLAARSSYAAEVPLVPKKSYRFNTTFGLKPRTRTDDTPMMLCLAQFLVDTGGRFVVHDHEVRGLVSGWLHERYGEMLLGRVGSTRKPLLKCTEPQIPGAHARGGALGIPFDFKVQGGALKAMNLDDAADTVGAVYGCLSGAWYGIDALASKWIQRL